MKTNPCCEGFITSNLKITIVGYAKYLCTNLISLSFSVIYPWSNLWLVGSIVLTMLLHIAVLYIEPLAALFSVSPLSWAEWKIVLYLSFPVILIDEVLKFFSRSPRGRRFPFRLWRSEILPKKSRDK